MIGTSVKTAFVSTNSITQGEQVASVWKPLFEQFNIHIDFAYRSFKWDSEANMKANVHVVIVGFSVARNSKEKIIYDSNMMNKVDNINAYLVDGPDVFIESRRKPLSDVLEMTTGNRPADGGHLILKEDDYREFIQKEPKADKFIKKLTGGTEFISGKYRYCLWLVDAEPSELRKMPLVMKRIKKVQEDRLQGAPDRQKLADTPTLFRETKNPNKYIIIPYTSSERRKYIPIGFLGNDVIPTDGARIIPEADIYYLGVLTSNIHMAWMRATAGRLKSDYRYSKNIVYNNFVWPEVTEEQKEKIEKTAQGILDARELYPNSSLEDLYDELTMPPELRKAHQDNDRAVMEAYGMDVRTTSESDAVAKLLELYNVLIAK